MLLLPIYLYMPMRDLVGAKAVVSNKNILNGNIVELHIRATGKLAIFPTVKNIDGIKVSQSVMKESPICMSITMVNFNENVLFLP